MLIMYVPCHSAVFIVEQCAFNSEGANISSILKLPSNRTENVSTNNSQSKRFRSPPQRNTQHVSESQFILQVQNRPQIIPELILINIIHWFVHRGQHVENRNKLTYHVVFFLIPLFYIHTGNWSTFQFILHGLQKADKNIYGMPGTQKLICSQL